MRRSKRRPAGEQVRETLTTSERAALEMLDRAGGVLDRWPVGRTVGLALARDRLVVVASDFTLLTDNGRRALHDARWTAAGTVSLAGRPSSAGTALAIPRHPGRR